MLQDVEKVVKTNKHRHGVQKLPTLDEKRGRDILLVNDQGTLSAEAAGAGGESPGGAGVTLLPGGTHSAP